VDDVDGAFLDEALVDEIDDADEQRDVTACPSK
jgi:hypothetical protein